MYWVYIVRCSDSSLYAGITTDLERRLGQHNGVFSGGARYTAARRPVALVWSKKYKNRSLASKEECRIKKQSRSEKEMLISSMS